MRFNTIIYASIRTCWPFSPFSREHKFPLGCSVTTDALMDPHPSKCISSESAHFVFSLYTIGCQSTASTTQTISYIITITSWNSLNTSTNQMKIGVIMPLTRCRISTCITCRTCAWYVDTMAMPISAWYPCVVITLHKMASSVCVCIHRNMLNNPKCDTKYIRIKLCVAYLWLILKTVIY